MTKASLAAFYRPQTFAQVVGQDMVKTVLSRAAQEDRVAPAYLLSGTRGVGKTTIARVFAKALNCVHAPVAEPCNECEACRRITQGSFVDVVEIDGASNRGIDDMRRLRDAVGYAPLEGRYKVFIIDEAHMLTKEAFNALLKTLEEPPARVTFILATTEQHKFPVTIVSRCQHFVFRQIPESVLEAHVSSILTREGHDFEPQTARLIARRAAGSVRDAMSLLGQSLALCGEGPLTAAQTRDVLGLAGQETTDRLLDALADHNVLAVASLVRSLLGQGSDIGFFLRELTTLWRNLFLLKQAGEAAAHDLDMPGDDIQRLLAAAGRFSLAYIHAAWQMTLDSQRRILTSLEPAAGLELLLLNLAVLPGLLPLPELRPDSFDGGSGPLSGSQPAGPAGSPVSPPPVSSPPASSVPPSSAQSSPPSASSPESAASRFGAARQETSPSFSSTYRPAPGAPLAPAGQSATVSAAASDSPPSVLSALSALSAKVATSTPALSFLPDEPPHPAAPSSAGSSIGSSADEDAPPWLSDDIPPCDEFEALPSPLFASVAPAVSADALAASPDVPTDALADVPRAAQGAAQADTPTLDARLAGMEFHEFCAEKTDLSPSLRQFTAQVNGDELLLMPLSVTAMNQLRTAEHQRTLEALALAWAKRPLHIVFVSPTAKKTEAECRAEIAAHPQVQVLQTLFDATLVRVIPQASPAHPIISKETRP